MTSDGLPACSKCGLVENTYLDEGAEWISSFDSFGVVADNARCPLAERNPELYSSSWGQSTAIKTNRMSAVSLKRMAKINFHQSMNHRDRSLYHAYADIDEKARDIPENVRSMAKLYYMKFCEKELTRGNVRIGIRANCVLHACNAAGVPRTMKEIAELWRIDPKHMSRTAQRLRKAIETREKSIRADPRDVLQRVFTYFQDAMQVGDRRRMNDMCDALSGSVELQSRTPATIAAAVASIVLSERVDRVEIAEKCSVSLPTLIRMENSVKHHLEEKSL
jgi:transcription initiation factor TFIIB